MMLQAEIKRLKEELRKTKDSLRYYRNKCSKLAKQNKTITRALQSAHKHIDTHIEGKSIEDILEEINNENTDNA